MKHGLNTDNENSCIPSVFHLCRYSGGHTRIRGSSPVVGWRPAAFAAIIVLQARGFPKNRSISLESAANLGRIRASQSDAFFLYDDGQSSWLT